MSEIDERDLEWFEVAFIVAFSVFIGGFVCVPYFWNQGEAQEGWYIQVGVWGFGISVALIAGPAGVVKLREMRGTRMDARVYRGHDDL